MPRNTKCRKICCFPDYYSFAPEETGSVNREKILMSLDEYEVIRLLDYEGLDQKECALRMGVARTTVTAIYESARKKLASAVVEGRRLRIAGGNIQIDRERIGFHVSLIKKGENDIEDEKVVNSQILDTNGEGCGALAGLLNINDVDALICGGIGGGAVNAVQEAGIKLYAGAGGNADAAVEALIAGTLDANGEANCDHHDHGHGEGHSCGHGSCH